MIYFKTFVYFDYCPILGLKDFRFYRLDYQKNKKGKGNRTKNSRL